MRVKPIQFIATVVSNEYTAKETRRTVFEVKDPSSEFTFSTGQFVNLHCPEIEGAVPPKPRAYSIASSMRVLPRFELCVKVIENGIGSGYIDSMKEGDEVEFTGPMGHFGRKKIKKNMLLVATGTGIAPMKAIVDEQQEDGFPVPCTLVFGVREECYASYKDYFQELAEEYENFSFFLYISRPEEESTSGYEGRVTDFFNENFEYLGEEVLICGNPAMVKQVRSMLIEQGVEKRDIVVEAY